MKRLFIFFIISWMFFPNVNCTSEESKQDVVTIQDLELFKDLLIDEVRRQVDLLNEENKLKDFNYIEKEKNSSSNLNNALNEVVSIKLLKILEDMNKDDRESFLKQFINGSWNHRYELVIIVIVLVAIGAVINSGDFVDWLSRETSRRFIENSSRVLSGSIKGFWDASCEIALNCWNSFANLFSDVS